MWEGPSWLVAEAGASSVDQQASPPARWPRVTTPPNRRQSLLSQADDSGLGLSFSSPPVAVKPTNRPSPLRTPSTRAIHNMKSPPSGFRSFRMSSFSSPAMSDRALRLSNTENVMGVRFCENSMEKAHGRVDLARLASPTVARCLNMPLPTSTSTPAPSSSSASVSRIGGSSDEFGGESSNLDCTMPMHCDIPETPSKCFSFDESGIFDDSFPMMSTSTPLKRLPFEPRVPRHGFDISDVAEGSMHSPPLNNHSPPTPSSFKRAMQQVSQQQEKQQQRRSNLKPRQLLADLDQQSMSEQDIKPFDQMMLSDIDTEDSLDGPPQKKRKDAGADQTFQSPKKPLKPFSRRWMRLVTGGTRAQREVTSDARAFLARRDQRSRTSSTTVVASPAPPAMPASNSGFW